VAAFKYLQMDHSAQKEHQGALLEKRYLPLAVPLCVCPSSSATLQGLPAVGVQPDVQGQQCVCDTAPLQGHRCVRVALSLCRVNQLRVCV